MRSSIIVAFIFCMNYAAGQVGSLNINVYDEFSQQPIEATISVESEGSSAQGFGNIQIDSLNSGIYTFEISAIGYTSEFLTEIRILPNQNISYDVGLFPISEQLETVEIISRIYKKTPESPVSLRSISSEEIQKNAGSNRDVSKAILSFPGVGTTASFRNDLFIRGGASSENKFYVDGIEVPVINHFQTQGASGGPRGILTVDFIQDVEFYSGAFPAKRNGALSSLFEFNLKRARKEKLGYKVVLGTDDFQLMADGPLSKDETWTGLLSVRKSNLQYLFESLGLPFLPSYYDINLKLSKKFKSGDELYFIGIGAIDQFEFNEEADPTLSNLTLIERLPKSPQWNYTFGMGYKHIAENGNWLFTYSRNMLDNQATKYYRNIEVPENLLLDYHSQEAENKIRVDRNLKWGEFQVSYGSNVNFATYKNDSYIRSVNQNESELDELNSDLNVFQYGIYFQTSRSFLDNKLKVSVGSRFDASDYSDHTQNPLNQFSPRISLSYKLNKSWFLNFNSGVNHQLPAYTALGFMEEENYVNQETLRYIRNTHFVGGIEFNGKNNLLITFEGYYKRYKNYPFSLRNQVSLANLGGDFGVVGNEPLDSRGRGETYGLELLMQKRTTNDFYGTMAYTFGYSKFSNSTEEFLPSSWDSRHILSFSAGKYFKRNWNLGARFRLQSGLPETPYDLQRSALVSNWNVANGPVQNYAELNSLRGNLSHQLDIRIEKKWTFKKWQLTPYLDIVNVYGSNNPSDLPVVNLQRDAGNLPIIENPDAPIDEQRYLLEIGKQDRNSILPYFGLIVEF